MWYWVLPSGIITGVCLMLPHYVFLGANLINTGGYVSLKKPTKETSLFNFKI
jgi:hypothetical protein